MAKTGLVPPGAPGHWNACSFHYGGSFSAQGPLDIYPDCKYGRFNHVDKTIEAQNYALMIQIWS